MESYLVFRNKKTKKYLRIDVSGCLVEVDDIRFAKLYENSSFNSFNMYKTAENHRMLTKLEIVKIEITAKSKVDLYKVHQSMKSDKKMNSI